MSLFPKIFNNQVIGNNSKNSKRNLLNEQVADGLAVMYEKDEADYRYVDEDADTVGLRYMDLLGSRIPADQQLEFGTRISQHVEASRASKGQIVYKADPKF